MEKKKADQKFGNARFVRQLAERAMRRQAERLAKIEVPSRDELMTIEASDLVFSEPVGSGNVTYLR
jgi:stage V sporulation protein K